MTAFKQNVEYKTTTKVQMILKIFIVLSESLLKVRKIAVYRFLISFLVLELLRSKDLKNYRKNGTKNVRS